MAMLLMMNMLFLICKKSSKLKYDNEFKADVMSVFLYLKYDQIVTRIKYLIGWLKNK